MPVLEIDGLTTEIDSSRFGTITTLDDLSLTLDEGEILGVVGETAAGKSGVAPNRARALAARRARRQGKHRIPR